MICIHPHPSVLLIITISTNLTFGAMNNIFHNFKLPSNKLKHPWRKYKPGKIDSNFEI